MSDQHEHQSDESQSDESQSDAEGHLYIPKDERAGATSDTEGHRRARGRLEDAGEGDVVADAEGHKRFRRLEDAGEGDMVADAEGHRRRRAHLEDADEGDVVADVEGHASGMPGDPINEPSAVRGRDGQGRR